VSSIFKDDKDLFSNTEGTYHFMAPELCNPDTDDYSGKAVDIWALGVSMYVMIFNELPYEDSNEYQLMQKILKAPLEISTKREISQGLRDLLLKFLEKDPEKRVKMAGLIEDPWLNDTEGPSLA
jgi:[calcium/calmodulin-dependent protein kinase] kinase